MSDMMSSVSSSSVIFIWKAFWNAPVSTDMARGMLAAMSPITFCTEAWVLAVIVAMTCSM